MITLDKKLSELMATYVKYIHPSYPSPRSEQLFLQKNGTPFQESKLAKRLPSFWAKSGVRNDIRVTATNIRKWIVTQCHTRKMNGDVDEDILRQAMCHSDKVARTHFLRMDKTAVAARATNVIARCTDDQDYDAKGSQSEDKAEAVGQHPLKSTEQSILTRTEQVTKPADEAKHATQGSKTYTE